MKYQNISRSFENPIYVYFFKHYCPNCNILLEKVKVSKIVNSAAPEAAGLDFSFGDGFMIGNVKFIWTEFHCPNCNINIKIDEMKLIEKSNKSK